MLPNRPLIYQAVLNLPKSPVSTGALFTTTYLATNTTVTNETTTTFAGYNILQPHPKRIVIVAAYHGVAAAATCTVNGISSYFRAQNTAHEFSLFAHQVPTGIDGTVVISATSSIRKAVSVYVAYPLNHTPLDSGTVSATTTTDANIANLKVQAGGFLIYAGGQHATLGTFTTTWNGTDGVTEDVDAQLESAGSYTMGRIHITNSTDLSDLNMAESTSGTKRLVAATWGPPA